VLVLSPALRDGARNRNRTVGRKAPCGAVYDYAHEHDSARVRPPRRIGEILSIHCRFDAGTDLPWLPEGCMLRESLVRYRSPAPRSPFSFSLEGDPLE
jgi:hypothetical protein